MVRFGTLPPIRNRFTSAEAIQPPLYYTLGTLAVLAGRKLAGHRDVAYPLAPFLQPNPAYHKEYADPADRPRAVMLHPPEERWLLWPLLLRGISILLGLGMIVLTYLAARTLVPPPAPAAVALIATTFAALIPQANFIRGSIGNENLGALMGAWIVWLLAGHLAQPPSARRITWLGIALGLAFLSKLSVGVLLLPVAWVLLVRRTDWRSLLRDGLRIGAILALLAAPFYLYRWAAYGDPLATEAWKLMLPTDSPWTLADLFWLQDPFRWYLWSSYWGVFGWQSIWLPSWVYFAFLGVTLLAMAGGAHLVWRRALTPAQHAACGALVMTVLLLYGVVIVISLRLIAWQGREMYPALAATCVLFGLGLGGLVLGRAATQPAGALPPWRRSLARLFVPALALSLFALNIYSIIWLVWPLLNVSGG
jgi:hypothetical protein